MGGGYPQDVSEKGIRPNIVPSPTTNPGADWVFNRVGSYVVDLITDYATSGVVSPTAFNVQTLGGALASVI